MNGQPASIQWTIMAEGLHFPEGPVALPDGSVILSEIAARRVTHIQPDGHARVLAEPGGGPNGLAVGPDGALYCCNGGGTRFRDLGTVREPFGASEDWSGGRIERIAPATGRVERLYDRCGDQSLSSPNDLVFDGAGGFWFTDLGKTRGRTRDLGGVHHGASDGTRIREAIFPLEAPNGIGLLPGDAALVVAETQTGRLWRFPVPAPGVVTVADSRWEKGKLIAAPGGLSGFDSLAVQADGAVVVATLVMGGLTRAHPDGRVEHIPLPLHDPYTTNLCFLGRTVFVTLGGRGLLLRGDWDAEGLPLHFSDKVRL
jgi:gluconolactonase